MAINTSDASAKLARTKSTAADQAAAMEQFNASMQAATPQVPKNLTMSDLAQQYATPEQAGAFNKLAAFQEKMHAFDIAGETARPATPKSLPEYVSPSVKNIEGEYNDVNDPTGSIRAGQNCTGDWKSTNDEMTAFDKWSNGRITQQYGPRYDGWGVDFQNENLCGLSSLNNPNYAVTQTYDGQRLTNEMVNATDGNDYVHNLTGNRFVKNIDTGKGNDYIDLRVRSGFNVKSGEGNDLIHIGSTKYGNVDGSGNIVDAGSGNDVIAMTAYASWNDPVNSTLKGGDGDDIVVMQSDAQENLHPTQPNHFGNVKADGGDGRDKFMIEVESKYLTATKNGDKTTIVSNDPKNQGTFELTNFEEVIAYRVGSDGKAYQEKLVISDNTPPTG